MIALGGHADHISAQAAVLGGIAAAAGIALVNSLGNLTGSGE